MDIDKSVEIVILGSGTCVPSKRRNSSGYWIQSGEVRMRLDCGSGTVHAMARYDLSWEMLSHQFISHFHVDHFGELPALLFALKWGRSNSYPRFKPFSIIGPQGLKNRLDSLRAAFGRDIFEFEFPLHIIEVSPGDRIELGEDVFLEVYRTPHTKESLAAKIMTGDLSIGYTGDTAYSPNLADFFSGVDVLIGECSHVNREKASPHLDIKDLTNIATSAGITHLVATHSYFDVEEEKLFSRLSSSFYGNITVAEDGDRICMKVSAFSK